MDKPADGVLDYGALIWLTSSIEVNIGIIFACMHAIKPLLSRIVPGLFGSTASDGRQPNYIGRQKSLNYIGGSQSTPSQTLSSEATRSGNWTGRFTKISFRSQESAITRLNDIDPSGSNIALHTIQQQASATNSLADASSLVTNGGHADEAVSMPTVSQDGSKGSASRF